MVILLCLTMIAQHSRFLRERFFVSRDRACFATRPQVLSRIETESGSSPHGTSRPPAVFLFREILCAVSLAGVFDDDQLVLFGKFHKRIHIGHLSVKMDRNDGRNRLAALVVDYNAEPVI